MTIFFRKKLFILISLINILAPLAPNDAENSKLVEQPSDKEQNMSAEQNFDRKSLFLNILFGLSVISGITLLAIALNPLSKASKNVQDYDEKILDPNKIDEKSGSNKDKMPENFIINPKSQILFTQTGNTCGLHATMNALRFAGVDLTGIFDITSQEKFEASAKKQFNNMIEDVVEKTLSQCALIISNKIPGLKQLDLTNEEDRKFVFTVILAAIDQNNTEQIKQAVDEFMKTSFDDNAKLVNLQTIIYNKFTSDSKSSRKLPSLFWGSFLQYFRDPASCKRIKKEDIFKHKALEWNGEMPYTEEIANFMKYLKIKYPDQLENVTPFNDEYLSDSEKVFIGIYSTVSPVGINSGFMHPEKGFISVLHSGIHFTAGCVKKDANGTLLVEVADSALDKVNRSVAKHLLVDPFQSPLRLR